MKKFKTKRHIKNKYKNIIILIIATLILILIARAKTFKIIEITPVKILDYTNIYSTTNKKQQLIDSFSQILKIDINKPTTILEYMIPYTEPNEKNEFYTIKQQKEQKEEPLIYIYNTHQTEQYIGNDITPNPTVLTASYYLKEQLEKLGIKTIVEETNISEILKNNNWNYDQSYKASRINLEKIKQTYPSIKIFIDLHRDALKHQQSTTTINEKDYAKVLFVIGKEHENYKKNIEFTETINNILKQKYPEITKGILQKEGPGVNGIYNQDLSENIILLEVGANENTIEEVTNTLDIISQVIKEKINEN